MILTACILLLVSGQTDNNCNTQINVALHNHEPCLCIKTYLTYRHDGTTHDNIPPQRGWASAVVESHWDRLRHFYKESDWESLITGDPDQSCESETSLILSRMRKVIPPARWSRAPLIHRGGHRNAVSLLPPNSGHGSG